MLRLSHPNPIDKSGNNMPWEKSFDIDKTLDAAMHVFWQRGYQRTSMQNLIKSMGINPGSIYGTFGNKRDLFVSVLRHYYEELVARFNQVAADKSPDEAVLEVFEFILKEKQENPDHCNGCLLVNTALEVAPHDEEISQLVVEAFNSLRGYFSENISRGQSTGQINSALDIDKTVDCLVALTLGLRVAVRLPYRDGQIRNVIEQIETMLA
jgi:TetR/AcrR family transcriptional repressor of nem operon